MKTILRHVAHLRSGDKGNTSTLSVIAYAPELYPILVEQVTVDGLARRLGSDVAGPIARYTVDAIQAVHFRIDGALGGGVSRNLAIDVYGKAFCAAMLTYPVEVPDALASLLVGAPVILPGGDVPAQGRRTGRDGAVLFETRE
jgi:hypothetical protein